ncbi:cysteine desulfurase family protein [Botrimarina hoheduenensis]|uniref:cysteine desulfurase n=1 Tax=Botrimarina hoheduenensis TaxID=2528000 RepID=A0A5C5VX91_9BACT|nr:cysteine desulfurase family protein [Botrimarina hoheduenensis]TWT42747.1 Cysteine desulfurase [Botrimarina hoheduenensis]
MAPSEPIYLDNHATTRVDPRVVEAMLPWFTEAYGNAGSVGHAYGHAAREAVEQARETIAGAIGARPGEIVFTSGATESNNLAIRGVAERPRRRGDHLVSVVTEHAAVLEPLERLARGTHRLSLLSVEPHTSSQAGVVDPQQAAETIDSDTCLVSVMLANNEIGVIQPLAPLASAAHAVGALLHTDATQAVGKLPIDVEALGVDLMSFSAHKLYGPKGVGALYVRGRDPIVRLAPLVVGGGQERGRRSGTHNVPGIVGFARAVELCTQTLEEERRHLRTLRDRLLAGLVAQIPDLRMCGPDPATTARLEGNLNVWIPQVDGETIMLAAPQVAMSSGAACSSADPEPSHVLRALGLSADEARCTLRLGVGRFNTMAQIEQAIEAIGDAVHRLRKG